MTGGCNVIVRSFRRKRRDNPWILRCARSFASAQDDIVGGLLRMTKGLHLRGTGGCFRMTGGRRARMTGLLCRRMTGWGSFAEKKDFHRSPAALLYAEKARWHYACFVGDENIAWLNIIVYVAKNAVFNFSTCAIHYQQFARVAHGSRFLRNAFFRQVIIKITCAHYEPFWRRALGRLLLLNSGNRNSFGDTYPRHGCDWWLLCSMH